MRVCPRLLGSLRPCPGPTRGHAAEPGEAGEDVALPMQVLAGKPPWSLRCAGVTVTPSCPSQAPGPGQVGARCLVRRPHRYPGGWGPWCSWTPLPRQLLSDHSVTFMHTGCCKILCYHQPCCLRKPLAGPGRTVLSCRGEILRAE